MEILDRPSDPDLNQFESGERARIMNNEFAYFDEEMEKRKQTLETIIQWLNALAETKRKIAFEEERRAKIWTMKVEKIKKLWDAKNSLTHGMETILSS